ncbi:uroporphyrinogen-III synthase [Allomuricauda sp. NBRC 101325]|uniref:uroporphyrinogen-III synthase n=1 Tax=Allomuricauda sp. NBRC 101325 TaxID=1113758 RepID=UPI0024A59C82|nr:uroporphyrinogen-III synthase [Muricauda sp. NBRC 101325]GLU43105.1 uroporphyrinogen III methyltransferase [Muricauda sp. NBRC 101325]
MKTVLSTKILTPAQKELFLNSGLGLVEYDALKIDFLNVEIPLDCSNYIFTSKNAVAAFLNQVKGAEVSKFNTFCVGEKTKALLEQNGLNVIEMANNASELGKNIVKNHKNEHFLFLCGNKRRDELPELLTENNIQFKEVEVYRTELNPKAFQRDFEGILFFSPSGIRSYLLENNMGNSTLFCIGDTTATEARKHSTQIITANKPTVENVLVQAIK